MNKFIAAAAALAAFGVLGVVRVAPAAAQEAGADASLVPTLGVRGQGQARVEPDVATVRLGALAQAETARQAQEQVNRTANAILQAIRGLDVPAEQIQTSELALQPVYAQEQTRPDQPWREPRIVGYQASNVVSVRLQDLAKVGPVIDAGLAAGANRLDGVFFGLDDDRAARAEALRAAVAEARAKAEALAGALELRLVEILEVNEGSVSVFTPQYDRAQVKMAFEASTAGTPVAAGQVVVDADVTIRWRIAPGPGAR
jgi:uncharacterized protein